MLKQKGDEMNIDFSDVSIGDYGDAGRLRHILSESTAINCYNINLSNVLIMLIEKIDNLQKQITELKGGEE